MAKYTEKDVAELGTYPKGTYRLKVFSIKHSSPEEALQVEAKFSIVDGPEGTAGQKYTERYRLGTEEDPQAESPTTRKDFRKAGMGWVHWLDFTKKTGTYVGDTEEEVEALNAHQPEVVADMGVREGKDRETGKPNGRKFNGLERYYAVGMKDPGASIATPAKKVNSGLKAALGIRSQLDEDEE